MEYFEILYSSKNKFYKKAIEAPPAQIERNEVLIKILNVGVCGSDLHNINQYSGETLRIGHEWIGEVTLSGEESNLRKGDLVSSTALLTCGKCSLCNESKNMHCESPTVLGSETLGMLRSWVILKEHQLVKIPNIDPVSATLLEVAAVGDEALNNFKKLSINNDQEILIFGAGPVGVMTALAAKREGYQYKLIEIENHRINIAKSAGLEAEPLGMALLNPSYEKSFKQIIDCSGDNNDRPGAFKYLPYFCGKKAVVLFVGKYSKNQDLNMEHFFNISPSFHWMRGMTSYSYSETVSKWNDTIAYLSKTLISHNFSSDQVNEAFELASRPDKSMKIIITF